MLNQSAVSVNPVNAYYREGLSRAILSDEHTTDAEYSRMIIDAAPVEVIDAARYSVDTLGDIEGALEDFQAHFNTLTRARVRVSERVKTGVRKLCYFVACVGIINKDRAAKNVENVDNYLASCDAKGARSMAETLAGVCNRYIVDFIAPAKRTRAAQDATQDAAPAVETIEEKERALELVATSAVKSLRRGVVPWRHLEHNLKLLPRSWDRLRPYSLSNTLIIESSPNLNNATLFITADRADIKEDGESIVDWRQYQFEGADIWQPKKLKVIPLKDDRGELIKDDDGKILVTRKVSKYGKVTVHDADLYPWLSKKRAEKYAQLEKIVETEKKERDAKRAALLGDEPVLWVTNLAALVREHFAKTKLTTERRALGEEIARYSIGSRLGFSGMSHGYKNEASDAARLLALCTQGDKKHNTTGHALQVVLKHVNKCVAAILYQSQPTAIKPRAEKQPAPVVEEKQPSSAPVKNDDEEAITDALETFEAEATQAKYTCGLVHQDNARRAENNALLAIEEARKNKSVPDDAFEIYSDRVERIHVDTAVALKEEAKRRYGAEWIDRHVTFC